MRRTGLASLWQTDFLISIWVGKLIIWIAVTYTWGPSKLAWAQITTFNLVQKLCCFLYLPCICCLCTGDYIGCKAIQKWTYKSYLSLQAALSEAAIPWPFSDLKHHSYGPTLLHVHFCCSSDSLAGTVQVLTVKKLTEQNKINRLVMTRRDGVTTKGNRSA